MGLLDRWRALVGRVATWRARRRRSSAGADGAKGATRDAPRAATAAGEFRSRAGAPLRSAGEVIIANWLDDHGYAWEYEARVAGFTPDFVLRKERILIEYWGMRGHNPRYDAKIQEKRRRYQKEGWTLIGVERRHLSRIDERLGRKLKG